MSTSLLSLSSEGTGERNPGLKWPGWGGGERQGESELPTSRTMHSQFPPFPTSVCFSYSYYFPISPGSKGKASKLGELEGKI